MENVTLGLTTTVKFIFYGVLAALSPAWGPFWLIGWVARNKFGAEYSDPDFLPAPAPELG